MIRRILIERKVAAHLFRSEPRICSSLQMFKEEEGDEDDMRKRAKQTISLFVKAQKHNHSQEETCILDPEHLKL
jgi:hypothetical protein